MENLKTLIFDFDGTLVDSMTQWSEKMLGILDGEGVEYPDDVMKKITPLGDIGVARYFITELGVSLTEEEILNRMDRFGIEAYRNTIPAKETVIETLQELKNRGYSLNILTASPHRMLDACLIRLKIFDLFDNVWSCDDFMTSKSDEKIYSRVAVLLGKQVDECIFLDDNITALRSAKSAGMRVFGVYDDTSSDIRGEIEEISEEYIFRFDELLKILC